MARFKTVERKVWIWECDKCKKVMESLYPEQLEVMKLVHGNVCGKKKKKKKVASRGKRKANRAAA